MTPSPLSLRAFVHRFLVALVVGGILTGALVVSTNVLETITASHIKKEHVDESLLTKGGNYLIIGSDTRAFVDTPSDASHFGTKTETTGQRSDTIMVAHIDPGKHTGVLVSFPRDLWVAIPGHGTAKINAAFAFGGPQLTIATIKQNFNIPISHFLEVDFAGFRDIVNAIGSVPIYFPAPARDKNTGLDIETAGCHDLTGDQALAYVRSRYYQFKNASGEWQYDPTSDIGRIQRQQYFIRSLSHAAIKTLLPNLPKFKKVVDKTVASLTSDQNFGGSDLRTLVKAFRNTDPKAFPMFTLPATNAYRDGQSVLLLDTGKAAPTLARLRNAQKKAPPVPNIPASSVSVSVENGSGYAHVAGTAMDDFGAAGFKLGNPAQDADRFNYDVTEVRYGPGDKTKAQLVLAYLGGAGKLVALSSRPSGEDVLVVIGGDYQQVTPPTTSTSAGHAASSAVSTTTSTTTPPNPGGVVPPAGC